MSFSWAKPYEPKTEIGKWFDDRLPLPRLIYGAIGGGNVLCTVCDLTIASERAVFGQVGPKVGSVDPGYGTALLARVRLPTPEAIARRFPHELSGGQLQRVELLLAAIGDHYGCPFRQKGKTDGLAQPAGTACYHDHLAVETLLHEVLCEKR